MFKSAIKFLCEKSQAPTLIAGCVFLRIYRILKAPFENKSEKGAAKYAFDRVRCERNLRILRARVLTE